MTEKSQVNDYNPNDNQRDAIAYAANTIQFLSSIIAKMSNSSNIIWIQNDLEDAKHHFEKLIELIPPKEEKKSNDQ
jgi:hypothetical protein